MVFVFVEQLGYGREMEISRVEFDEYIMLNHFTCEFMISVSVALALCSLNNINTLLFGSGMLSADSRSEWVFGDV